MIPRRFLVRIAPFWILVLIAGSLMPSSSKDALGTSNTAKNPIQTGPSLNHRLVHFASFGSTALLLVLIAETTGQQILAVLGVMALGLMLECIQYRTGSFYFEWWDVRDDSIAALVALAVGRWSAVRRLIVRYS